MSDEQPKRMRGQKDREAAYRQGFFDGVQHGVDELRYAKELESAREGAMLAGLAKYRRTLSAQPKRTRKAKVDKAVAAAGAVS